MTTAIGSSFGNTFPTPGVTPPRGGTQPEILNEELRRSTEARPTEDSRPIAFQAPGAQGTEEAGTRRPVEPAADDQRFASFNAPTDQQVQQARDSGQTRGSFLDIRA